MGVRIAVGSLTIIKISLREFFSAILSLNASHLLVILSHREKEITLMNYLTNQIFTLELSVES
jgi:hypothetical protein